MSPCQTCLRSPHPRPARSAVRSAYMGYRSAARPSCSRHACACPSCRWRAAPCIAQCPQASTGYSSMRRAIMWSRPALWIASCAALPCEHRLLSKRISYPWHRKAHGDVRLPATLAAAPPRGSGGGCKRISSRGAVDAYQAALGLLASPKLCWSQASSMTQLALRPCIFTI